MASPDRNELHGVFCLAMRARERAAATRSDHPQRSLHFVSLKSAALLRQERKHKMATPQQVQSRGRWSLILGTIFAFAALAAVAYADNIDNSLDGSADAVAEVMPLNVGGANGTTQLSVDQTNDDGKPGCNLTGSRTLVVAVVSSNTSVATVSPSSVTFTSCGMIPSLTVTPVSQGSATISLSQTSNSTEGTFNLANATFTVNVAPPPNTAPTLTIAGVTSGAEYAKGSVPAATCEVTDAEDGPKSFAATLSAVTGGDYTSDGIGSQTASCSYTDAGGLHAEGSKTYNIVDPSAPSIGYTLNPATANGDNGWYKSNVSLAWTVTDAQSPNSLQTDGCENQNVTADQVETPYSCSASSAGGSAGPVSVSIKRDATAPSVSGAPTTSANGDGWYNGNVTIDWTCSDATSGVAACPADSVISGEGQGLTASSGPASDNAGNVASATTSPVVNIDKTAPNAPTVNLSPVANAQGWNNAAVTVTFVWAGDGGATGAQSGEGSCTAATIVSAESLTVAGTTVSGTCTDKAGNTSAATAATVKLDKTGPTIEADAGSYVSGTWTNQTVTVKFVCMDALSGLLGTCPADVIVSSSTAAAGQNVSGTVSDNAGNTVTSSTINVKVDKTAPTISGSRLPLANAAGWNNTDVVVSFSCDDTLSGVDSCGPTPVTLSANGSGQSVLGTAVDRAGNSNTATVSNVNIDKLAPSVAYTSASPAANAAGWHKSNVTATFTATDTLSGFAPSGAMTTTDTSITSGEGSDVTVGSPAFVDRAGNAVTAGAASASFKIDKTAPTVALVGGPADGGAYYFGSVPAAPTCTASDSLSGPDGSCSVSGYGTSVGSHTVSASAKDVAGNVGSSASRTYTVLAWTLNGFFQPVDMGTNMFNTVKSGSTVPLKFRVFSGSTEQTDVAAVKSLSYVKITCAGVAIEDAIEEIAPTGGTLLRYDSTGGQFIYNLKTSGKAGECYRATMTTLDGSTLVANFKLK